jgi:hypothetical protein
MSAAHTLLTDGTFIYAWLTSLEDRQRKAVKEVSPGEEIPLNTSPASTWLHCSVGPEPTQEEENFTQVRVLMPFARHSPLMLNDLS